VALSPQPDETFIREVDEDLRRDKLRSLWNRYGRTSMVALSLGLIAFGGYLYWQEVKRENVSKSAEIYASALGSLGNGEASKAMPQLESLAKDGPPGYRALATLTLAGANVEAGEVTKATALLDALAQDKKVPQVFRDTAAFRSVSLKFDTLKPAEAEAALKPLAQEGQPFFAAAAELLAITYMEQGKGNLARPLLEAVAGLETAPPGIRGRAGNLLQLIPADDTAKVPATTPAKPKE
jgi:hypothetical protein